MRQWEKYNEWEAKLRERILATVAQQKAASLVAQNSVRQWLTDFKGLTQPPKASVKQNIRVEYSKLMGWEDLIYRAKQYDEPLPKWLKDSKDQRNLDKYTDPSKACGGAKHGFSSCFLVKKEDKDWLSDKNRKTFNENMKIPQFMKTVDEFRKLLKSVNFFQ
ncbi:hypothetical protein MMC31_002471 [Peltigera leucophlebia]|nr:hypothetical protein [Peltigera leucophlebia]